MIATVAPRLLSFLLFRTNRPAAVPVVVFLLGIGLSRFIHTYLFVALAVACAALGGASFLALRRQNLPISLTLGLAALCIGGVLTALAQRDSFPDSDLRKLTSRGLFKLDEPVYFEGCVVEDAQRQGGEIISTVRLSAFLVKDHWIPCRGKGRLRIVLSEMEASRISTLKLRQGDRVRGWATWRLPDNYKNPGSADRKQSLARRGIYILGRIKSDRLMESLGGACSSPWTRPAVSVRNYIRDSLEAIHLSNGNQPAAILASLLIGDYSHLDNSTREVFQNSGTLHVLVVSGLHVAWIAGICLQVFKLVRLPERIGHPLTALLILFYANIVGFQASITRCLWMFILYLLGRMLLRRADPGNIVLASAFILLAVQPNWLFEIGFQLSFLSVTAIAMTAVPGIEGYVKPLFNPLRNSGNPDRLFLQPGPWHRAGRKLRTKCEILFEEIGDCLSPSLSILLCSLARVIAYTAMVIASGVVISFSVQIWIAPLLAHSFNRISWISPLAGLIIVPLSSLVLAAGMLSVLVCSLNLFSPALLELAGSLSSLLLGTTKDIASITGAWQRCPTPSASWVLGGIVLLFAWSYFKWRRPWIPLVYTAFLFAFLSLGSLPGVGILINLAKSIKQSEKAAIWPRNTPTLDLTFLDVGQGDSIFIRFPNKDIWLVDAGNLFQLPAGEESRQVFDLGEAVVSRFLWQAWIVRLDRMILSHTDMDHAGGAPSILKNFDIATLVHSHVASDGVMAEILNVARSKKITVAKVFAGMHEMIGRVSVEVLHPAPNSDLATSNESSLVLRFSYGRFSALLTGDLDQSGELEMLCRYPSPHSLLLKVAHHGSRSGTSNLFLNAVRPRWAVISVGRKNPYRHPSKDVTTRLLRHGVRLFLTPDQGAITFETDGNNYLIHTYVGGILEEGRL